MTGQITLNTSSATYIYERKSHIHSFYTYPDLVLHESQQQLQRRPGVGSRGDRHELRVSAWAQMSTNNMIAIIKWLQEALKMLTLTKYTLNWCTLKFFAIFCNHLFDFFWNINLKYEIHLAKLQNADKF